jgi:hypothetical protein
MLTPGGSVETIVVTVSAPLLEHGAVDRWPECGSTAISAASHQRSQLHVGDDAQIS